MTQNKLELKNNCRTRITKDIPFIIVVAFHININWNTKMFQKWQVYKTKVVTLASLRWNQTAVFTALLKLYMQMTYVIWSIVEQVESSKGGVWNKINTIHTHIFLHSFSLS
jgi:hypothetical protein